jgi:hypothetical protein
MSESNVITPTTSTKVAIHPKRIDELVRDYRNGLNGCIDKLEMGNNSKLTGNEHQSQRVIKINNLIKTINTDKDEIGQQGVSPEREKQINDIMDVLGIKRDNTMTARIKLEKIEEQCRDFVSIKMVKW